MLFFYFLFPARSFSFLCPLRAFNKCLPGVITNSCSRLPCGIDASATPIKLDPREREREKVKIYVTHTHTHSAVIRFAFYCKFSTQIYVNKIRNSCKCPNQIKFVSLCCHAPAALPHTHTPTQLATGSAVKGSDAVVVVVVGFLKPELKMRYAISFAAWQINGACN